ncbi:hypothetical protein HDU87_006760 [Geranomyces variabilis]|uniref:Pre-mRNA-splicing factor 38 n=1 Tax=Geranomyces variabilis TaxID=109894 RepID=A0AAD5XTU4_9FUNG|nr:hypothetical protein HDU87_006760 [Geranomyces variabilis]
MANRTVTEATNIHGTNPQFLIEKIIRTRIYDSLYWKESCFALTAETIIDKAVALQSIGGQYGNQKPTEFLCLALKMLQLQPEKEILRLYIQNEDYKYLRALGAFYLRLTGTAVEIYRYLEPLLLDFRKLRRRNISGDFELTYMDEFVDELLRSDRVCDTILPRITKRHILEETGELEPRVSPLEEDLMDEDEEGLKPTKGTAMATGGGGHGMNQAVGRRPEPVNRRHRARMATTAVRDLLPGLAIDVRGRGPHRKPVTAANQHTVLTAALVLLGVVATTTTVTTDGAMPAHGVETRLASVTIAVLHATVAVVVGIAIMIAITSETLTAAAATTGIEAAATDLALAPQTDILIGATGEAAGPAPAVAAAAAAVSAAIAVQMTEPTGHHPASACAAGMTVRDLMSSRKVDALFKKKTSDKKSSSSRADDGGSGAGGGGGAQESMSVEETNKMRAALGLKPLKM